MNGLGIGSGQHARLISELAMAPFEGRKMAQEEIGGQMKIGLMAEEGERRRRLAPLQERQAQLGVETGEAQLGTAQIGLENSRKAQEFGRRFAEEYKSNPKQDLLALKKRIAGEVGLSEEVFQAIEEESKKFEATLKTGIDIFKFAGKEGLKRWLAERPELAEVISISDLPEDPVRGIMVKFPDGTELKAVRDEATGKVEIVKPTAEGGFTLGPGQARYGATGEKITEGPPIEQKLPAELETFETETGISAAKRGSKEYQDAIMKWRQGKKEAIQISSPFEVGKFAATLRKEFEDLRPVKDYRDTMAKFNVMKSAYKESLQTDNFVGVDQALITLFNKMTDPQSVVRESEYARTATDLALWNKIKGKVEKLKAGGAGLTQEDRRALILMGSKFMKEYSDIYKQEVTRYRSYADMSGINPEQIVHEFKPPDLSFEEVKPSGGGLRDQAIAELQKRGKVVNEDSIKRAVELLGGK